MNSLIPGGHVTQNKRGVDWMEVLIPEDTEPDGNTPYNLRVHLTFFLSNWNCIFGNGCPGTFPSESSTHPDDAGCCRDSFYVHDRADEAKVNAMMELLTDEDWDKELRSYVMSRNPTVENPTGRMGWKRTIFDRGDHLDEDDDLVEDFEAKGRVYKNSCVFNNRNGGSVGSTGKTGCAFHHLAQRTGQDHVDVMPRVCWQAPIRFEQSDDDETRWELYPWDVSEWVQDKGEDDRFSDYSWFTCYWCIETPDAYVGEDIVWRYMEHELRVILGTEVYDVVDAAIQERLGSGNKYHNMPGAVLNEGRPLIPLIVGDRKPEREPSPWPEVVERTMKRNATKLPHHF